MRAARFATVAFFGLELTACAVGRSLFTSSEDLADYRTFRVAAHEGVRLARAERYLGKHPRGAWVAEVREAFDAEEPAYFERASETRKKTSEYLADLPHGPHAEAAISLLTAFDAHVEDLATAKLLRESRRTEATLERASVQRRGLGEAILADVAALLDPNVYGAKADELPAPLRHALRGLAPTTWGHPEPRRTDDYFYSIPARLVRESRVATVELDVVFERGAVVRTILSGPDLFVHWDEADEVISRDPTNVRDRAVGAAHAVDLLDGVFEARLPARRCNVSSSAPREVLVRRCDGWIAIVTVGASPGDSDAIVLSALPK